MSEVERHLRLGGAGVFVRDVGDGPPVLLLNGIGAHVEMWRPLERALDGMRVISFDAPGTGRSPAPVLPTTMGGLATLVERLLDALGLPAADVLGYSFGGALAQQLAVSAPERVRRLVLAATFPGWGGVPGRLPTLLSMSTPLRYYSRTFYERTAGTVAGGRARHDRAYVRRLWSDRAAQVPSMRGYAYQVWAMTWWTSLPFLDRISAPTLVVVGDDDPIVPLSNALMMAARIPKARVHVAPGEGHFLLLDERSAAPAAVREFVAAADPADSAVWRAARTAGCADADRQLRTDGLGALPWGAVSAVVRRACAG